MSKSIGRHRSSTPGLIHTPVDWEPSNSHRDGVDVATILGRAVAEAPLDPTVGTVLSDSMVTQLADLTALPHVDDHTLLDPLLEPLAGPFMEAGHDA